MAQGRAAGRPVGKRADIGSANLRVARLHLSGFLILQVSGQRLDHSPELRASLDAAGAVLIEGPLCPGDGRQRVSLPRLSDLEADAVIELADGRWAGVEVKLGVRDVETAARNLVKLRKRIDQKSTGECAALFVVTGTGYSYHRADGVAVVSIGSLGM